MIDHSQITIGNFEGEKGISSSTQRVAMCLHLTTNVNHILPDWALLKLNTPIMLCLLSLCTWLMNALVWKWILWRTNGVDWQAAARNTTLSLMQCGGSHFARDSWCKSRENVLTRSQWEVRVCERKREVEMEMNKMIFYRLSDHVSGGEVVWFLQAQWLTLAFCSLALLLCSFVPVFLTVGCLLLSLLFFNLLISPSLFFLFNLFLFLYFLFHLFRTNCRGMYTLVDIYSEVDIWLPAVVVMQGQAVVKIKFALTCRILNIRN